MIAFLSFWTIWLVGVLLLADRPHNIRLLIIYLPAAIVLAFISSVTLRSYVMAWLIIHVVGASALYLHDKRRMWLVPASLGGLISLWVQSGAFYWQSLAGFPLVLSICAATMGAVYAGWLTAIMIRRRASGIKECVLRIMGRKEIID